jgi:hypothetical protein
MSQFDGAPNKEVAALNAHKRKELAERVGAQTSGKCPVCGKPSGRGRYGYPSSDCGSDDCRAKLRARARANRERALKPLSGGGMDWKPGVPGQGGREHR